MWGTQCWGMGHLGAGVICSNLRLDQANVRVQLPSGERVDSGLRKLGRWSAMALRPVVMPCSIRGRFLGVEASWVLACRFGHARGGDDGLGEERGGVYRAEGLSSDGLYAEGLW